MKIQRYSKHCGILIPDALGTWVKGSDMDKVLSQAQEAQFRLRKVQEGFAAPEVSDWHVTEALKALDKILEE